MNADSSGSTLDVLVIGGGQAGLAVGYHLGRRGLRSLVVDAGRETGQAWASRWDSLRLFTPRLYDSLPGLPFPAGANPYPSKDEVAAYLTTYAARFDLPVRRDTTITSLTAYDGGYLAKADADSIEAKHVVVATGAFQRPFTPRLSERIDPTVHQIHSVEYKRAAALPPGKVLVVGAANSGCQIALEVSGTHTVDLSVGTRLPTLPQRPLGRDIWDWASAVRLDRVTADSRLGRRLARRDPIIGTGPRRLARRHRIRLRPRLSAASGRRVTFADGGTASYDAVVWATGFRSDHAWIDVECACDGAGRLQQSRGVTSSPGLYTVGLAWQRTRGSALLGWVGNDAAFVADHIAGLAR
jgi:putative flavoprotein involved in K+ transport